MGLHEDTANSCIFRTKMKFVGHSYPVNPDLNLSKPINEPDDAKTSCLLEVCLVKYSDFILFQIFHNGSRKRHNDPKTDSQRMSKRWTFMHKHP